MLCLQVSYSLINQRCTAVEVILDSGCSHHHLCCPLTGTYSIVLIFITQCFIIESHTFLWTVKTVEGMRSNCHVRLCESLTNNIACAHDEINFALVRALRVRPAVVVILASLYMCMMRPRKVGCQKSKFLYIFWCQLKILMNYY